MRKSVLATCLAIAAFFIWRPIAGAGERLAPAAAKQQIGIRAQAVLKALAHRHFAELASYVDPVKGLRFSPYAASDTDVVLTRDDLNSRAKLGRVRHWGDYDGSGEPIRMSFIKYYRRFVYDRDYLRAPQIGYDQFLGPEEADEYERNYDDVYPHSIFVDYYIPRGLDTDERPWSSLILVFQQSDGEWYLVGVIHDEWTV